MKVLLLGAKGMLGQALQRELADQEITAWDREELDITDAEAVKKRVGEVMPEVIVNAAAHTNVDEAEQQRELALAVNAEGVRNVARAAKDTGATVVQYSTDYVFPGTNERGYGEDDIPGPAVNVYGASKLAGEQALQGSGARYFLIRTAWLYGAGGKNFVDTMLKLGHEQSEIRVVNDQHGSPTWTRDLAQATRRLVTGGYDQGVYHLVNSGRATWYEVAQETFRIAHLSVKVVPVTSGQFPRPAKRPAYSVLKSTKGPKLRPWPEALRDYIELNSSPI